MRLVAASGPLSCALAICAGAGSLALADFSPGCALPFESVWKHHPIDTTCAKHEGNATGPAAQGGEPGEELLLRN
jgi:hypothetical protein